MRDIEIYEPALCCSSGVCGPDVDQALVDFNAALPALEGEGVKVQRYNLASAPLAFAESAPVKSFLDTAGVDGLPITVVNDVVVLTGAYPTGTQMRKFAGAITELPVLQPAGGATDDCCGGQSGCC